MAEKKPNGGAKGQGSAVEALSFDEALAELQRVVTELEAGAMPLERTLELYERGVDLHTHCGRLLTGAELRIQSLVERAGGRIEAVGQAAGVREHIQQDADDEEEDDGNDFGGADDDAGEDDTGFAG